MGKVLETPVVLTIAGSDSGGGAGIQADLKTFSALGVFGTTAITCLTAQNPEAIGAIVAMDPGFVRQQIKMVCDAFQVAVAKTGMLYSAEIIRAVAAADVQEGITVLVVDPVMVSATGAHLIEESAMSALCDDLLPQARVVTPNLREAEILWGNPITSERELRAAAEAIGERFDVACVVKGGNLPGEEVLDVLFDEGEEHVFRGPRVPDASGHGAGCAFSAALSAYLARGLNLSDAVGRAKHFVQMALQRAVTAGRHRPLNFFWNVTHGD